MNLVYYKTIVFKKIIYTNKQKKPKPKPKNHDSSLKHTGEPKLCPISWANVTWDTIGGTCLP